jgi:hypothetical protein
MMTLFLAVAAAAAAFWPASRGLSIPAAFAPRQNPHATYEDAIRALSHVRGRLLATESLAEKERAAVDALTLALVNGSDRE